MNDSKSESGGLEAKDLDLYVLTNRQISDMGVLLLKLAQRLRHPALFSFLRTFWHCALLRL